MWPVGGTEQAAILARDWIVFVIAGGAVAALVMGLIFFTIVRYRARRDAGEPPQFKNNPPLEITWTLIPLVLVIGLFVYTYRAEARVDGLVANPALTVHVNAYRWGWTFAYDGGPVISGAAGAPVLGGSHQPPPEMVLPLAQTTRISLTSSDVIHSFWVPDFLFKRDAIPGKINTFDLTPTKTGTYVGRCAQFCGLNHALMTFIVRVVPPQAFARWRAAAARS